MTVLPAFHPKDPDPEGRHVWIKTFVRGPGALVTLHFVGLRLRPVLLRRPRPDRRHPDTVVYGDTPHDPEPGRAVVLYGRPAAAFESPAEGPHRVDLRVLGDVDPVFVIRPLEV